MLVGTAYQREPYGPYGAKLFGFDDPHNRGLLLVPPDKLLTIMRAARDKGWQLSAHSQGGGAVDVLLGVFEKLDRERPIAPTRSHVIHASFQSPEAIALMKRLGVLADAQPDWLYLDGEALEKVEGDEGMRYFIPLRSYVDAGIIVAGGSDHMIGFDKNTATNPYNPFLGMYIAVSRKTIQGSVIHPEQRLTRQEALKMYTIWPAYLQFNEKDRGSIEVGKLADMVVIDRDYLTCPENEIKDIEPTVTILNGRIAYTREQQGAHQWKPPVSKASHGALRLGLFCSSPCLYPSLPGPRRLSGMARTTATSSAKRGTTGSSCRRTMRPRGNATP
jgi:hypothetical protein